MRRKPLIPVMAQPDDGYNEYRVRIAELFNNDMHLQMSTLFEEFGIIRNNFYDFIHGKPTLSYEKVVSLLKALEGKNNNQTVKEAIRTMNDKQLESFLKDFSTMSYATPDLDLSRYLNSPYKKKQ